MNTFSRWQRSSRFGQRVDGVVLDVCLWMLTVMFLLLGITALLVALPIVWILHALELIYHRVQDWIDAMLSMPSKMRCFSARMLERFRRRT